MNNAFSDHPPFRCMRCHKSGPTKDALGMYWCKDHEHHSKVINWGAAHNWPDLQSYPYMIIEGAYFWVSAMVIGCEDWAWMALAAIECMNESEVA